MNVLVIGYYTRGTPYEEEAKRFAESCNRFGINYTLQEFDPFEDWNSAVAAKPGFIRDLIEVIREPDAYLYVDVDARFKGVPDYGFLENVAFAAHEWKRSVHHETEILTGTMWFLNCDTVMDFLSDWADSTPPFQYMDCPEQKSLGLVLERWKPLMTTAILPAEWCWIDGDFEEKHGIGHKPVIVHYQASRRYKEQVNRRKNLPKAKPSP